MKRKLLGTLVGMVFLTVFCLSATAAGPIAPVTPSFFLGNSVVVHPLNQLLETAYQAVYAVSPNRLSTMAPLPNDIQVNGKSIAGQAYRRTINNTSYVSLRAVMEALRPDAQVSWVDGQSQVTAPGLVLTAQPGNDYLVVNGRYLYTPNGIFMEQHRVLVPVRTLATALGAEIEWDSSNNNISIYETANPPLSGDYNEESLYWLSRVINAESGNQPMEGKIAVGTVILNRVESPLFPNGIREVIFDYRYGNYQFSTVPNGAIYAAPNEESIIAAKLVLDGAREAGNSLYFNVNSLNCWASNNRPFAMTIAGHDFYY